MHKELDKNADSSAKMNAFSDLFNKKSVKAGFGEKKWTVQMSKLYQLCKLKETLN